jgi:hypothetical protein
MKNCSLKLASCILAVGLFAVVSAYLLQDESRGWCRPLAGALPSRLDGWEITDRAVGPSEVVAEATSAILQYDDAVVRVYRRSGYEIEVFAARWNAGKTSFYTPAAHLPDKCWPGAGFSRSAAGERLIGQRQWAWREFKHSSGTLETIFAHSVGGLSINYNREGRLNYLKLLKGWISRPTTLRSGQIFIRFSSSTLVSEWWKIPGFSELATNISCLLDGG